MLVDFTQA